MKTPSNLFALTKSEQRVVVIIMIVLLTGTVTKYYLNQQSHLALPATAPSGATPSSPLLEEEQAAPDEAR